MALDIIIVNYKSAGLILDCLERLYRDRLADAFNVIVVDNASGDDSERRITGAYPSVKWIALADNGGFARGNNAGIRASQGEAVLLLNGDTLPDAAVVDACYRRLMSAEFVAAGVHLLNADGSAQISGNYFMKGGLNYLLPLPYLGAMIKRLGAVAGIKAPHVDEEKAPSAAGRKVSDMPIPVDWINGAFLMVKRRFIDQAGLLDEDFFLYAEEAEWCARLRKLGPLCIYDDLKLIHLQGETANQAFGSVTKGYYNLYDRKGLQIMLSNFVRIRKQFGVGWFLVQSFFYILEIPFFAIGLLFSFRKTPGRLTWTQFRQYCKNIGYVIGKTPTIIRNKPYFYKVPG